MMKIQNATCFECHSVFLHYIVKVNATDFLHGLL